VRFTTRITAVLRQHHDLMKDDQRSAAAFIVRALGPDGEHDILAQVVIDALGTIEWPGVLGQSGLPAVAERAAADVISYEIPTSSARTVSGIAAGATIRESSRPDRDLPTTRGAERAGAPTDGSLRPRPSPIVDRL
jgi:hypothetical protein